MNFKIIFVSCCFVANYHCSGADFFHDSEEPVYDIEYPTGKTVKSGFNDVPKAAKSDKPPAKNTKKNASSDTKTLIRLLEKNIQLLKMMIKLLKQYEKE